jgi:hypothetical protein
MTTAVDPGKCAIKNQSASVTIQPAAQIRQLDEPYFVRVEDIATQGPNYTKNARDSFTSRISSFGCCFVARPGAHEIGRRTEQLAATVRYRSYPVGTFSRTRLVIYTLCQSWSVAVAWVNAWFSRLRSLLSLRNHFSRSPGPLTFWRSARVVSYYGAAAVNNGNIRCGCGGNRTSKVLH